MRLAIGVIAWEADEDDEALDRLGQSVEGLEIAPTRIWRSWEHATADAAARWRELLAERGLRVPALQSLMYGVNGASLTGDAQSRRAASDQLSRVAGLCGALGAGIAVFGSPSNRRRGDLSHDEATRRAREALLPAAEAFAANSAALGIEPNPPEYGCDFLTTYAEAAEFVAFLAHPGVTRHLDMGQLQLSGEQPDLATYPPSHVHLSTPHLEPFRADPPDWHEDLFAQLRATGYDGWASIEQRPQAAGLDGVFDAVGAARRVLADS